MKLNCGTRRREEVNRIDSREHGFLRWETPCVSVFAGDLRASNKKQDTPIGVGLSVSLIEVMEGRNSGAAP